MPQRAQRQARPFGHRADVHRGHLGVLTHHGALSPPSGVASPQHRPARTCAPRHVRRDPRQRNPHVTVGLPLVSDELQIPDPAPEPRPVTGAPDADRSHSWTAALRDPRRMKTEVLGGLVVALALIPEAIAFSIIAGVDPRVGLFASFTMAVTIAFLGGRPAMISAATGAVALVVAPVVREYGVDYLLATVILGG